MPSSLQLLEYISFVPLVVGSLFGAWFVWHLINFLITYFRYRHIPGHVSFLPAVIDSMLHKRIYIYHQYVCTLDAYKRYPEASVIKLQFGSVCTLIVARDKALLKELLVKNYKSISKGDVLAPVGLFGNNMFSADSSDPLWKKHRTMSNPIFTGAAHLRNVFRVTIEETNKMLDFWKRIYGVNEKNGAIEKVNVTNEFKSVTLSVINRVAFDYDIHIFDNDVKHRDELHEWVNNLLAGLLYNFVFPKWAFEYLPFGIFKRFRESKERFREAALTMIERKQAEKEKSNEIKDDEDLLSLLLSSSEAAKEDQKLSKDELLSALFIIFFAGFETSSVSLNFMLRQLAKYPEVQQRIYEEIRSEISSQEEITYEVITEKLHFLSSFMKEVLRVKTPVGGGARIVMKKGGETLGGVKYPAGTQFLASYYSMHYFAKNGEDDFKPDRFMPTKTDAAVTPDYLNIDFNTDEILPFSIGPRDCIGKRMALLEMKLILVMLLLKFQLQVPKGLEEQQDSIPETYIVTRTVLDPYLIDFIPRQ